MKADEGATAVLRHAQDERVPEKGWLADRKAFLFDLDGTLVDSSAVHAQAFREILAELAPEALATFDYDRIRGLTTPDGFVSLGITDQSLLARAIAAKRRRYQSSVQTGSVRPFPGAAELLTHLRSRGRQLAIVTGASRSATARLLSATGLSRFVTHVVCAEDVAHGKPAPDPYLRALELLAAPAASAIAIEDAMPGIASARAAGVDAVLVNSPIRAYPEAGAGCPPFFPTMEGLLRAVVAEIP